jgi:hypothetical protein
VVPTRKRSGLARLRYPLAVAVIAIAIVSLEVWILSQIPEPLSLPRAEATRPIRGTSHELAAASKTRGSVIQAFAANVSTAVEAAPVNVRARAVRATTRRPAVPRRPQHTTARREATEPAIQPAAAPAAFKGALAIEVSPEGARILVDGRPAGAAPLLLLDLLAGSRLVRIEAEGHEPWSGAIRVVADEQTSLSVRLPPKSNR